MRWLLPILVLAFLLRIYHLSYPLGDLHSWRQADTAAVARTLYRYGGNLWLPVCQVEASHLGEQGAECRVPLLNPQFDSFVTIDGKATWMDGRQHTNDTRNHFAEFPIYQAFVAHTALVFDAIPWSRAWLIWLSRGIDSVGVLLDPPANVNRWEEVQYQLNQMQATPIDSIVFAGRIVSIICSLVGIALIYLLVKRYFVVKVALGAAFVMAVLPYSVFWSRTVLPDSMMVMCCLGGLYFLHRLLEHVNTNKNYFVEFICCVLFFSLALLLKVFVIFLLLPIAALLFAHYGLNLKAWGRYLALFLVCLVPFLFWRWWIQSDTLRLAGIPSSEWLFNGSGVRLKPAWWYWLFQTRLDHYMFNFTGLGLGMIGLLFYKEGVEKLRNSESRMNKSETRKSIFSDLYIRILSVTANLDAFWVWPLTVVSCFLYLVVFATGNVQHEYYQLPLVPFLSVFVSLGFWYVWTVREAWVGWLTRGVLCGMIGLMILLGAQKVKDWYGQRMPSYVYAGMRADAILPKAAIVVADFGGDTTMLYYANRPGWSIVEFSFDELRRKGATAYISAFRSDGVNELARQYPVLEETNEYVILDLGN